MNLKEFSLKMDNILNEKDTKLNQESNNEIKIEEIKNNEKK